MKRVLIVDTETTSLTPDYASGSGVIWELAVIERATGEEYAWRMEPDVSVASPEALAVGRFAERTRGMRHATRAEVDARYGPHAWSVTRRTNLWNLARVRSRDCHWSDPADLAGVLVENFLQDATIVGAVPSFDAGFLSAFLAHHGQDPKPWHYRLRDIGSMAWAWLQAHHLPHHLPAPSMDAGTDDLARAMGIEPGDFERHSALGDCRLVAAMLDVIEGGRL